MTEGDDETAEYIRNIVREEAKNVNVNSSNNNNQNNEVSVKSLSEFADAGRKLKSAFESPIENAIVSKFNENFMDRVFPMMSNDSNQQRKSSFLDSGFMISVGQGLPNALPNIFDTLMMRIGKENTDNVMSGIANTFLGGGKQQNSQIDGTQNDQNVNEIIMSLNPDDPSDLHKYMSLKNINDIDEARKDLIEKKSYIISMMQQQQISQQQPIQNQNSNQNNNLENALQEQNNMIKNLITVIDEDKQNIQYIMNEINNLKEKEKSEPINKELDNMSEVPDIIDAEVNEVNEINKINDNKSEIKEMNIINNNDIKVNFEEIDNSKEKVLK